MLDEKEEGKTDIQVSSPMNAIWDKTLSLRSSGFEMGHTFFPALSIWVMIESSTTDDPAKLLPMSMKVGKLPVVKPLMRWSVVVGGSA